MFNIKLIISFRNISKITVKLKGNDLNYNETPPQIFLSKTSDILRSYSLWWFPKLISKNKNNFKFDNEVTNIDSIMF